MRAPAATGPVVAHGVGDGRHVALEAVPSAAAAQLLPANARYRAVLAGDGELALVIVGAEGRILGRLHIADDVPLHASSGMRVDYEDIGGRAAQIEAVAFAGSIDGRARVGERAANFRVRVGEDGSLAGERWSAVQRDATAELIELRRARAIGADLGALAAQLASGGAFAEVDRCNLAERLGLAELALELSVRAWAGEDRARLPATFEYLGDGFGCGR